MNITCTSCYKPQEAVVSTEKPHRVICRYCGKKIDGVNEFTVRTLVNQKKFVQEDKSGFSFYCEPCNGVHKGILQKGTSQDKKKLWIKCSNCGAEMKNVSDFMMRQMSGFPKTDEIK